MSGRPTYIPGALSRIEGLGEKAIAAFFKDIPRELLKVVTSRLRPLAGFRPGTNAAVQRQLQFLAQKIAARRTPKTFARSSEETALYGLWRAWSQSQLAETTIVRQLFDGLDEDESEESGTSDKSERMATALKALVASDTCPRETLERFVAFSPFENIDEFMVLAKAARSGVEIERDSTLLDLPDRLHKDEGRLHVLETKLEASERKTALIRSELDEIGRAVPDLRNKAAKTRASVGELRQTLAAATKSQNALEETIARRLALSEKQTAAVAEKLASLESDVARTAQNLGRLSEQISAYDGRLDQILADVQSGAAESKSQNEGLSGYRSLIARFEQLESMLLKLDETKPGKEAVVEPGRLEGAAEKVALQPPESALLLERLTLESGLSVKPLHSVAEMLSSLDSALVEAGLKKSTATVFAEEILATVASEQVVFFRGGLGVDVARKCALSLSGTSVFRVTTPLGLTDPSLLRQQLRNRPKPASGSLSAIIVEGVNNSPLDLLRDVLLDQATSRIGSLGRQTPTIVFASLADGAGAFPLEPSYLELGPVFDLEQMDWRRLRREKLPALGSVAHDAWLSITTIWDGKTIDCEEALKGARLLAHKRNARFEANVVRAFSTLKTIRREEGLTALQSVTFGWLAPYCQSLAARADDIDAQIDGGRCDGAVADERLKSLLAEYRGRATGESA